MILIAGTKYIYRSAFYTFIESRTKDDGVVQFVLWNPTTGYVCAYEGEKILPADDAKEIGELSPGQMFVFYDGSSEPREVVSHKGKYSCYYADDCFEQCPSNTLVKVL